jgi:hypothetical protein
MTIVKSFLSIVNHPFINVHPKVAELILRASERLAFSRGIKYYGEVGLRLLECYCDVTCQRITLETLKTSQIERILWEFALALSGNALIVADEKYLRTNTRRLFDAITEIRTEEPDTFPLFWDFNRYAHQLREETPKLNATSQQLTYWAGWPVVTDKNKMVRLRLAQVVHSHGPTFAADIYREVNRYYTKRSRSLLSNWNQMFDYLASHGTEYPESNFRTEQGVKRFMHSYTYHHFSKAKASGNDPQSEIKNWNRFVGGLEKCLCHTKIWAALSTPIKRPPPSTKPSSETKTRKLEDGLLVQEKLLTTIPLTVTDSEAMELLFFHIKNDLSIVRKWATHEAADLKARQTRRSELAAQGTPIYIYEGRGVKLKYSLADICATLENAGSQVPSAFLCKVYRTLTGKKISAFGLATAFGFPTAGTLMAHQTLLVLEHPQITTEALRDLELYNEDGAMTGFDAELKTLTMYKKRKDSEVREQIIELTDYTVSIVKEIIDITTVLRKKQIHANHDNHRLLFLTSGNAFFPIAKASATSWSEKTFENSSGQRQLITTQFQPHCDLEKTELLEFITKVRLTRIRTSRAVEIYLKTRNPEDMSKALGHEHYYPELLGHYLPECILGFIKARWIRIFQKNIVCEAMKDSPYLLRATKFATMEELHLFLENHSINMPPEAIDPERNEDKPKANNPEAVISISEPFLVSLLSLEVAVNEATNQDRLCGRAVYWSVFANKLKSVITNGYDRTLKKRLKNAIELADPTKMKALIYV